MYQALMNLGANIGQKLQDIYQLRGFEDGLARCKELGIKQVDIEVRAKYAQRLRPSNGVYFYPREFNLIKADVTFYAMADGKEAFRFKTDYRRVRHLLNEGSWEDRFVMPQKFGTLNPESNYTLNLGTVWHSRAEDETRYLAKEFKQMLLSDFVPKLKKMLKLRGMDARYRSAKAKRKILIQGVENLI